MNNITDNPGKANYQDEQNRLRTLLLGNGKGSSTKPAFVSTGSKQSKAKGGTGTRQQQRVIIGVDIQDIARIKAEAGTSSPLLGYWIDLNTIAFRKGNPFIATYAILRAESSLSDRQISACNKQLEALKMLLIVRESNTRKPNTYKLLKGRYVNHQRHPEKGSALSQKTTTPPPADTLQEPPDTG